MVEKATEYQYSSTAYHCGLVANNIITDYNIGVNVQEYEYYLMMGENQKALGVLRRTGQYVDGTAHTNGIESVWALLKRGYNGVFHHFSDKHIGHIYQQDFHVAPNPK
jgi:hypothetical protein